eukprot:scaffold59025_cov53-Phaeocystis_antarctica.AAC.6
MKCTFATRAWTCTRPPPACFRRSRRASANSWPSITAAWTATSVPCCCGVTNPNPNANPNPDPDPVPNPNPDPVPNPNPNPNHNPNPGPGQVLLRRYKP